MRFFLGTHMPSWLWKDEFCDIPLFISATRLRSYKMRGGFPRAKMDWALDSGGFTALTVHGGYQVELQEYAREVRRYSTEIGRLQWAAAMDFMCEEKALLKAGTVETFEEHWGTLERHLVSRCDCEEQTQSDDDGDCLVCHRRLDDSKFTKEYRRTQQNSCIAYHQQLTTQNFVQLQAIAPDLPWVPVLQGYTSASQYTYHADLYAKAGVDLHSYPVVGVGSICRRQGQATREAIEIVQTLASDEWVESFEVELTPKTGAHPRKMTRLAKGPRMLTGRKALTNLHAFGFEGSALPFLKGQIVSADSLAWSGIARPEKRGIKLQECIDEGAKHKYCNNCPRWALRWRDELIAKVGLNPYTAHLRADIQQLIEAEARALFAALRSDATTPEEQAEMAELLRSPETLEKIYRRLAGACSRHGAMA